MNDELFIAEGSGLIVKRGRNDPIEVFGRLDGHARDGWLGITEDQLRWLAEVGVPAALAALHKPDPATEGASGG
jgi:hypothetical protein